MDFFKKLKIIFTKKDINDMPKEVIYYYRIPGDKPLFDKYFYPELTTVAVLCGFCASYGEARRQLAMGSFSVCRLNSLVPQKSVPIYQGKNICSYSWLYRLDNGYKEEANDLKNGVILYKGSIPMYIEFQEADIETYVKQLVPFKNYVKQNGRLNADFDNYPLPIYQEAMRQLGMLDN